MFNSAFFSNRFLIIFDIFVGYFNADRSIEIQTKIILTNLNIQKNGNTN